jgi:hypothetical protein
MTTTDGRQAREPRRIGKAVITDEVGENFSWASIDLGNLEQSVLAGDMVRAVYSDTLAAGLGFGRCSNIMKVEIRPR